MSNGREANFGPAHGISRFLEQTHQGEMSQMFSRRRQHNEPMHTWTARKWPAVYWREVGRSFLFVVELRRGHHNSLQAISIQGMPGDNWFLFGKDYVIYLFCCEI